MRRGCPPPAVGRVESLCGGGRVLPSISMLATVPVGTQKIRLGSPQLGWMNEATHLATNAAALQAQLDKDGYLLLRGLIDPAKVRRGLEKITSVLADADYFQPGTDPCDRQLAGGENLKSGTGPASSGRQPYDQYQLMHSPEVLSVLESAELHALFALLWSEPATTFDFKWFRGVGPGGFSGFHMDNVYMGRGSLQLHTVWVPWSAIPVELGGLVVLEGSNSLAGFRKMRETCELVLFRSLVRRTFHSALIALQTASTTLTRHRFRTAATSPTTRWNFCSTIVVRAGLLPPNTALAML